MTRNSQAGQADINERIGVEGEEDLSEFGYVFKAHRQTVTKKLKDMSNMELCKIYRSLSGRATQYYTDANRAKEREESLNRRAENLMEIAEKVENYATQRGFSVVDLIKEKFTKPF